MSMTFSRLTSHDGTSGLDTGSPLYAIRVDASAGGPVTADIEINGLTPAHYSGAAPYAGVNLGVMPAGDYTVRGSQLLPDLTDGATIYQLHTERSTGGIITNADLATVALGSPNSLALAVVPAEVRVAAGGNAADDTAGTGARTLIVSGVAANGFYAEEEITLLGASASANTTNEWYAINGIDVGGVGSGATNAGDILLEWGAGPDAGTPATSLMLAGTSTSNRCFMCLPLEQNALVVRELTFVSTAACTVTVVMRGYRAASRLAASDYVVSKQTVVLNAGVTKITPNWEIRTTYDGVLPVLCFINLLVTTTGATTLTCDWTLEACP